MSYNQPTGTGDDAWAIQHGWDVFGADGEKVGDVAEVYGNYFLIEKGFLFKSSLYVPFSAITDVEHDRVYLNVSKNEIENLGWDEIPQGGLDYDTTRTTTTTAGTAGYDRSDQFTDRTTDTTRTARGTDLDEDRMEIPVVEEELQVRKRASEQGRVRVHKDVVEEEQTLNVPVREEEVHVQRRRVDARDATDAPDDAFREEDIEIPVYGEEVDVTKQARVREEIDISKTARERDKRVSGKVRREDVHIEGEKTRPVEGDRDMERGTTPH